MVPTTISFVKLYWKWNKNKMVVHFLFILISLNINILMKLKLQYSFNKMVLNCAKLGLPPEAELMIWPILELKYTLLRTRKLGQLLSFKQVSSSVEVVCHLVGGWVGKSKSNLTQPIWSCS